MRLGTTVIAAGRARNPDPDGYLGSRRIVRQVFAFLRDEYGLIPIGKPNLEIEHASETVLIATQPLPFYKLPLEIKPHAPGFRIYEVEDILYMDDRSASLEPAPMSRVATEAEAQGLYDAMAQLLRKRCGDILAGKPGALEKLRDASNERERLPIEMYDRLYGPAATASKP